MLILLKWLCVWMKNAVVYVSRHMYSCFLKLCFACIVESVVCMTYCIYHFINYFHHLPKKSKITGVVFFIILCHVLLYTYIGKGGIHVNRSMAAQLLKEINPCTGKAKPYGTMHKTLKFLSKYS